MSTEVRGECEGCPEQVLDLDLSSADLATRNILVDSVVREDRVDPLRLTKRPSGVEFMREFASLLR